MYDKPAAKSIRHANHNRICRVVSKINHHLVVDDKYRMRAILRAPLRSTPEIEKKQKEKRKSFAIVVCWAMTVTIIDR